MNPKPHILLILHLPPPIHGSAVVGEYIRTSERINGEFECSYINLATATDLNDLGKIGFRKLKAYFCLLARIRRELRHKPDLCYVTPNAKGGAFYKDFVVVALLKLWKQRIVLHYHNKGVAQAGRNGFNSFLYRIFFNKTKVILLAENLYEDIKKYIRRKDVFICPNGIPDEKDNIPSRTYRTLHILFLSNLLHSKGFGILLEACRILKADGYTYTCEIAGGETAEMNKETLQQLIVSYHLENEVFYSGPKSGEEKKECYQRANLFVLPTYNECFPLVLLEAMKYGLTCISTKEGGIPAIIDDRITGFLIEKKDAVQLAGLMKKLADAPEMNKQMGQAAREKFGRSFTSPEFESCLSSIFHKLIS